MKILILSTSTGGGHMSAAKALKSYILENSCNSVVEVVDTLEYISPILNKTLSDGYSYIVKKAPKIFGKIYDASNKENKFSDLIVHLNNLCSKKLLNLIENFQADVIVSTHMFPNEMVSNLKQKGKIAIPLVCIITDYAPHKTWLNKNVDAYIVSNDNMADKMIKMGISKEKIYPYGIPVDPSFFIQKEKNKVLTELDLDPKIPSILLMAGSFGVNNIFKIYNSLTQIDTDFQIIVITGKNKKLYNAFEKRININEQNLRQKIHIKSVDILKKAIKLHSDKLVKLMKIRHNHRHLNNKTTKLILFTDEVSKYMQAADLIITKPGGLTVSEALACNLPMAVFNAIPGQEEENADFLVKNNMAVKIYSEKNCKEVIKKLLFDKKSLSSMKNSCKLFDKSQSNKKTLSLIETLVHNNFNK